MRVLITRPRHQAAATAAALRRRGHGTMTAPLLEVVPAPNAKARDGPYDLVLLTSANAVQALTREDLARPLFAVGRATAKAARRAGASDIVTAEGDWRALCEAVIGDPRVRPGATALHLAGDVVRGDLAGTLLRHGIVYRVREVYRTIEAEALPGAVVRAFHRQELDAVLLFSPRTAGVLRRLIRAHALSDALGDVLAACLSQPIAAEIADLRWRDVRVARRRDQSALLDCLAAP